MYSIKYRGKPIEMVRAKNIAEDMDDEDLRSIGQLCLDEFTSDKQSRSEWEKWYAEAMLMALQVTEVKNTPWPNASNVKFPLLTVASLNFHAMAYPALINSNEVVKGRVIGEDPDGAIQARGDRVGKHMSFNLIDGSDWEEETDTGLIVLPIMGSVFKRTIFNRTKRKISSMLVMPQELVVPYYTTSLANCPRSTYLFEVSGNGIEERKRVGIYRKGDYTKSYNVREMDALDQARLKVQKLATSDPYDSVEMVQMCEQCRDLDLDGDGYSEPYIVTFVRKTGQVARIVARYNRYGIEEEKSGRIIRIESEDLYSRIQLLPAPDGGFYGMGFGLMLGPINDAVDSLINQVIDQGSMHAAGGGFIGRGVRMRKGDNIFRPNEWKVADSTGAVLKDNIVPLPTREPSQTLVSLAMFLINYGERISGATEGQMGELPDPNAKTGAMKIANRNGQRIFGGIFKRIWRGSKEEFRKVYNLTNWYWDEQGRDSMAVAKALGCTQEDYQFPDSMVIPAADPNTVTDEDQQYQAGLVLNTALQVPGHNMGAVVHKLYRAAKITDIDKLFPLDDKGQPAIQPPPDPKTLELEIKSQANEIKAKDSENKNQIATMALMIESQNLDAQRGVLIAQIAKLQAEAESAPMGHIVGLLQTQVAAMEARNQSIQTTIRAIQDGKKLQLEEKKLDKEEKKDESSSSK